MVSVPSSCRGVPAVCASVMYSGCTVDGDGGWVRVPVVESMGGDRSDGVGVWDVTVDDRVAVNGE